MIISPPQEMDPKFLNKTISENTMKIDKISEHIYIYVYKYIYSYIYICENTMKIEKSVKSLPPPRTISENTIKIPFPGEVSHLPAGTFKKDDDFPNFHR